MNQYQEQFRDFMEAKGFHVTRQRLSIASLLFNMPGHYTIEELYDALRKVEPGIGQATLYRTLKLLIEAGLVQELRIGDGASRFGAVSHRKAHNHLVCLGCGNIVELYSETLENIQDKLAIQHGFILADQAHCIYGLCADCRNENSAQ